MTFLTKAIYKFNAITLKIPIPYWANRKINLKFICKPLKILNKKDKAGGLSITDLKIYYIFIVIKIIVLATTDMELNGPKSKIHMWTNIASASCYLPKKPET